MTKEVAVVKKTITEEDEYTIKPQATTPSLDTSQWPLLLQNYDKRESPDELTSLRRVFRCFWGIFRDPMARLVSRFRWLTNDLQNLQSLSELATSLPSPMAALP
jgi:hypothetical protein